MDAEEDDEEDRRDRLAPGEDLQTSLDDINMLRTVRAANTISKFFRMRYGQTHVTILLEIRHTRTCKMNTAYTHMHHNTRTQAEQRSCAERK